MKWLLLFCLLGEVSIDDHDLISKDGEHFFSLRATKSDGRGEAWYIRNEPGGALRAYQGKYACGNSGSATTIDLNLIRCWREARNVFGEQCWELDNRYQEDGNLRYGVHVEYERRGAGYDASVIRPYAIDLEGDQVSSGDDLQEHSHLVPGEVITLAQGKLVDVEAAPPPGYMQRASWTNRAHHEPTTVHRTDILERDWYGHIKGESTYMVLSLKEGETWNTGDARLLLVTTFQGTNYIVGRGRFTIELDTGLDTLLIDLPLTRFYFAYRAGGMFRWEVHDTSNESTGLRLAIPLRDRALDEELLTAYVQSTYYVDEEGNREKRYSDPGGFLRKAVEQPVDEALGVARGLTIHFKPGRFFAATVESWQRERDWLAFMEEWPAPGFQLRKRLELQVVGKAVVGEDESGTGLNLDELRKCADSAYDEGEYADAAKAYSKLIETDRQDRIAYEMRGLCHMKLDNHLAALGDFTTAVNLKATATGYFNRALAFSVLENYQAAIDDYERAYTLNPKHAATLNAAAWLWATCLDGSVRNGRRAVVAGKKACQLTNWEEPSYIDTLAAGYAEVGDFAAAVRYQQTACDRLAGNARTRALARLEKYRHRLPHHE